MHPSRAAGFAARPAQIGISPARATAFALLRQIETSDAHSDVLLQSRAVSALSRADRNLVTTLVMGTLRWQIALDTTIAVLLSRPDAALPLEARLSLRLGAFQMLYLERIPEHAAVHESVELCRAAGQPQAAGMVNAVLRRLLREQKPGSGQTAIYESAARFGERLGHPRWLVERWVQAYGRQAAIAICEGGQHVPRSGLLLSPFASPVQEEVSATSNLRLPSTSLPEGTVLSAISDGPRRSGREEEPWDPEDAETPARGGGFAAFTDGMDDGSRLVAELAAAAAPEARRVWDCCAAPGGKTAVLLARLPEADVLASDASERRLGLLHSRLTKAGIARGRWRDRVCRAELLPETEAPFDLVLCDVPCSGTGTLSRNPEVRHRLQETDLDRHAERQRAILRAALRRVSTRGRLVYSTCSLEPEECEAVVEAEAQGWRRVAAGELVRGLQEQGVLRGDVPWQSLLSGDGIRTLPGVHPCDGFYAVVLERVQPSL